MDTVQSQVLCALQQAANETFDNLKKDAAHRIVMAEQRATTLEQELSMVKQHALMMLLRLKTDTDAKVRRTLSSLRFDNVYGIHHGLVLLCSHHG